MAKAEENGKDGLTRISFTIDQSLRRNMRIAAAHADQEVGEWAIRVLNAAADQSLGKAKARK